MKIEFVIYLLDNSVPNDFDEALSRASCRLKKVDGPYASKPHAIAAIEERLKNNMYGKNYVILDTYSML